MSGVIDIIIPLGFFATVGGIWVTNIVANHKSRADVNETARRAIEVGHPLSPETFSYLQKPLRPPEHDLRTGIILCALALGFFTTALAFPANNPASITATVAPTKVAPVSPTPASAASGAAEAASTASAVVTVVQSDSGATVSLTRDDDDDKGGSANIDFDGDGFMVPGILVGFLGIGYLASWGIRRKKVA
jgi:hypothetical protein